MSEATHTNQDVHSCPHCGLKPNLESLKEAHVHMECPKCHCCGPDAITYNDAVHKWNASVQDYIRYYQSHND